MLEQLMLDKETELMNSPGMGEVVPEPLPLEALPPLSSNEGGEDAA